MQSVDRLLLIEDSPWRKTMTVDSPKAQLFEV